MSPSDEDIEKLFQGGIEDNVHFDYDPEAWTQMETLLDEDNKRRNLLFWLLGGLALILGMILFSYFTSREDQSLSERAVEEDRIEVQSIAEDITEPSNDVSTKALNSEIESSEFKNSDLSAKEALSSINESNSISNEAATIQKNTNTGTESNVNQNIGTQNTSLENQSSYNETSGTENPLAPANNPVIAPEIETLDDQQLQNLLENQVLPASQKRDQVNIENQDEPINDLVIDRNVDDPENVIPQRRESFDFDILPNALSDLLAYEILSSQDIQMALILTPNPPELPEPRKNAIVATFAYGSSVSSTPTTGYDEFDPSLALGISIFSNKHFSTTLGFGYTRDRYTAGPDDYTPWKGYWTSSKPLSTLADCRILTGNVGFNYYFNDVARNGFFAGSSALTTFMLTEKYEYQYDHTYPGQKKGWKGKRLNNHILSTLTFSAGYQYYIRDGLSISIIPHYELPLYGIGFGRIKLSSTGINFGVNYNLRK